MHAHAGIVVQYVSKSRTYCVSLIRVITVCDGAQNASTGTPLRCASRLVVHNLTCRSAPPRYRRRHRMTSRDVGDVKRRRGQDQVAVVTVELQLLVQHVTTSGDLGRY